MGQVRYQETKRGAGRWVEAAVSAQVSLHGSSSPSQASLLLTGCLWQAQVGFPGSGAPEWEFVNEHSWDPHGKQGRGEKKQDWGGEDAELRGLSQQGGGFRMLRPLHPLPGSVKPGRLNHGQGWGLQAGDPEMADS